jgi:thymidylate synthase (FAD)
MVGRVAAHANDITQRGVFQAAIYGVMVAVQGGAMLVELIAITHMVKGPDPTPDALIAYAGRVCTRSRQTGRVAEFIRDRIIAGHESIIEHASASFEISDVSLVTLKQIDRHRLVSLSVESERYCESGDNALVTPPSIAENPEAAALFAEALDILRDVYHDLRKLGIPREDARFALSQATTTHLVWTANFREWRHICELRCAPQAQWEIRAVCTEILRQLYGVSAACFGDLIEKFNVEV